MKRKFCFFTIVTLVLLLLAGCNLKKKIGESITEKVLEKASGDENADVDIKDGKITYKTDEGSVTVDDKGNVTSKSSGKKDTKEDISSEDDGNGLGIFNKDDENDDASADEGTQESSSDSTDADTSVDSDEDTVKISGEDGNLVMSSEDKWPEGMAADKMPKFDKGVVTYSMNADNGCSISISEVEADDAKDYIKDVKDAGYTEETFEATASTGITYSAKKGDNTITISYGTDDKLLTIIFEVSNQ